MTSNVPESHRSKGASRQSRAECLGATAEDHAKVRERWYRNHHPWKLNRDYARITGYPETIPLCLQSRVLRELRRNICIIASTSRAIATQANQSPNN
jgi:hypothetical protein